MNIRGILLLVAVVAVMSLSCFVSCVHNDESDRFGFDRIDSICNSDPRIAISMLDSLGDITMQKSKRHRYNLLWIKAHDKAYVPHTSDSLVLEVIDYYSNHKDNPHWPEALYYGGRVYSDLGDYPKSLDYFQKALDALPDKPDNLNFRGIILSQMGNLLDELRMFSQAVSYLEESISISRQIGDEVGLAYDCLRVAGIFIHLSEFDKANQYIEEALRRDSLLSESDRALAMTHCSAVLYYTDKIDSALKVVRGLPESVDSAFQGYPVSFAAKIYLAANKADSAYMYALKLVESNDPSYQGVGFSLLFDERLKKYVPKDSLESLSVRYAENSEYQLNTHEAQEAIVSASRYNYKRHELRRNKADNLKEVYGNFLFVASLLLFVVLIVAILLGIKKRRLHSKLQYSDMRMMKMNMEHGRDLKKMEAEKELLEEKVESLSDKIDKNEETIFRLSAENDILQNSLIDKNIGSYLSKEKISESKQKLLVKFLEMNQNEDHAFESNDLEESAAFMELRDFVENDRIITDKKFWTILGLEVEKSSPGFKNRLQILTNGRMTDTDYQIALLIRCRVSASRSAIVLGIKNNSVSSRRSSLASKIFGSQTATKILDDLIRSL